VHPGSSRLWVVEVSELSGARRRFLIRSNTEPAHEDAAHLLMSVATPVDIGGQPVFSSRLNLKTLKVVEEPADAASHPDAGDRYYVRGGSAN